MATSLAPIPFLFVDGAGEAFNPQLGFDVEMVFDATTQNHFVRVSSGKYNELVKITAPEWLRLGSPDQIIARAAADAVMERVDEVAVPMVERRERGMRRQVRRILWDVSAALDQIAIPRTRCSASPTSDTGARAAISTTSSTARER